MWTEEDGEQEGRRYVQLLRCCHTDASEVIYKLDVTEINTK
jgi:hypothetical protein